MACGTPVVACKLGSVPEVIDYGITGYYHENIDLLPSLTEKAMLLDRKKIRNHAMTRFNINQMLDNYISLYYDILND